MATGPPTPAPAPSKMEKLCGLLKDHWGKIASWASGGGLPTLDQLWTQLLPIPQELRLIGVLAGLLLSALVVLTAAVVYHVWIGALDRPRKLIWLLAYAGIMLVLSATFYALFFVEQWWKRVPEEWTGVIYFVVEPAVYGASFAFLAGFAFVIGRLVYDLFW